MERKTCELKGLDERGTALARIATLGVPDKDSDILEPGLLGGEQIVPLLVAHDWSRLPAGKVRAFERDGQLLADVKINMGTPDGRALHSALKFDLDNPPARAEWSFGFTIPLNGSEMRTFGDGRRGRVIRRLELHEVSTVIRGASINTATLAVKEAIPDQATLAAMHERVRTLALKGNAHQAEVVRSGLATLARGAALLAKLDSEIPYRYLHLEGFDLQHPRRHLAREALFFAAKELGIAPPALRFFTSADPERADFTDEPMWGYAGKDGIGIEWSLSPDEMVRVVAHEVAHVAGLDEEKADSFGKQFAARHGTQFGVAPRPGVGMTMEQAVAIAQVIKSGLPIPMTR